MSSDLGWEACSVLLCRDEEAIGTCDVETGLEILEVLRGVGMVVVVGDSLDGRGCASVDFVEEWGRSPYASHGDSPEGRDYRVVDTVAVGVAEIGIGYGGEENFLTVVETEP